MAHFMGKVELESLVLQHFGVKSNLKLIINPVLIQHDMQSDHWLCTNSPTAHAAIVLCDWKAVHAYKHG